MKSVYLIGSLRNQDIPKIAEKLRSYDLDVFDDWYAAGPEADDYWQAYETARGRTYDEALKGYAAKNVFAFDRHHLNRCDAAVLAMPAGKSGHLELGYAAGLGKVTYVLFDQPPERYDVMYQFATGGVFFDVDKLAEELRAVYDPVTDERLDPHQYSIKDGILYYHWKGDALKRR